MIIDDEDEPAGTCEECGAPCSPEDLIDGLCPDCYAKSLEPPEGCGVQ